MLAGLAGLLLAACGDPQPRPTGASVSLVPAGSAWRYLDDGSHPGDGWTAVDFDDRSWASGPAKLGYGEGDEATVVRCRPGWPAAEPCPAGGPADRHASVLFRHAFEVDDPASFSRLRLRLLKDDAAVVHLNGEAVVHANLPLGRVDLDAYAAHEVIDETAWIGYRLEPRLLRPGRNVLAVQVHQAGAADDDLAFDLELRAFDPDRTALLRGPYLQLGTRDGAVVRWRTGNPARGVVRFGPTPDQLLGYVEDRRLSTEHELRLEGLEPGTTYYYAVETGRRRLAGGDEHHRFTTAPAPGSSAPVRVWVLGDSGSGDAWAAKVKNAFLRWAGDRLPDVWLTLGDNAYESGTDREHQRAVFDMYPRLLARTFLWPALGNHDLRSADAKKGTGPYFDAFTLPTAGEAGGVASGTEAWYSFDWGDVHFVCLDSAGSDLRAGKPMMRWLERDLAANDRPWVIAYWHHPPYTRGWHDSDDPKGWQMAAMRENALPLLEAAGVDLVLAGHSHSYERSVLLAGHHGASDTLEPSMVLDAGDGRDDGDGAYRQRGGRGAVYVVAGNGARLAEADFGHPVMAVAHQRRGSLVIDVEGRRLDVTFVAVDGEVLDRFTLYDG